MAWYISSYEHGQVVVFKETKHQTVSYGREVKMTQVPMGLKR